MREIYSSKQFDIDHGSGYRIGMSARDMLARELQHQPESVACKLLDYLHSLTPTLSKKSFDHKKGENFATYWSQFYGAFEGEKWEEPSELSVENREDW